MRADPPNVPCRPATRGLAVLALLVVVSGCASGPAVRPHLTALVLGDEAAAIGEALGTAGAETEVTIAPLPDAPARPPLDASAVADVLATARASYEAGDYEACGAALAEPALLDRALEAEDRPTAARLTWWRAACARAGSGPDAAAEPLTTMARLGLSRPGADVETVAASLDVQLADVRAEIAAQPTVAWSVLIPDDATLALDGAAVRCTERCTLATAPGPHHVRVTGPGRIARALWASPEHEQMLEVTLDEASPEEAAAAWRALYQAEERESAPSVRLLRRALRTEHLVLVLAEGGALRGLYATSEGIVARAERLAVPPPIESAAPSLLFELVPWARPQPWWETPWPWLALGAIALGAATALTYYYTAPIVGPSTVRVMP